MSDFPVFAAYPLMYGLGDDGDMWYQNADGFWTRIVRPIDFDTVNYVLTLDDVTGVPTWVESSDVGGGGGVASGVKLRHSANQSTSSGVSLLLDFDTEVFDTDGYHDATNNSRITIPTDGQGDRYGHLNVNVAWAAHTFGSYRQITIRRNGTTVEADQMTPSAGINSEIHQQASVDVKASEGDYFEVLVAQDTGTNINIVAAAPWTPLFSFMRY